MIRIDIRRVKAEEEGTLRAWMAELNRRGAEVSETLAREGTRHEQAYLLKTSDGPVLIYAMEAGDQDRAAEAFRDSSSLIDVEHKRIMKQVLAGTPHAELVYECVIGDATSA
jgi:Family of unknown function (DUF6176)